jgi:hypothetical protein
VSDTDRLAALLRPFASDAYAAQIAAKALIAAGVTCSAESDQQVAATPAPLDERLAALVAAAERVALGLEVADRWLPGVEWCQRSAAALRTAIAAAYADDHA